MGSLQRDRKWMGGLQEKIYMEDCEASMVTGAQKATDVETVVSRRQQQNSTWHRRFSRDENLTMTGPVAATPPEARFDQNSTRLYVNNLGQFRSLKRFGDRPDPYFDWRRCVGYFFLMVWWGAIWGTSQGELQAPGTGACVFDLPGQFP